MRAVAALCLLAACGFDHGKPSLRGDGGGSGDDAAMIDSPPGCTTYSTQFDTCAIGVGLGTTDLVLAGANTYDTDTGTLVTPSGTVTVPHQIVTTTDGPIDVVFVAKFTLQPNATLRVTGPNNDRPFGIASLGAVKIDGTLDLAVNGAGARDDANCTSDGNKGGNDAAGGAGGGGAGFGGAGGGGSNGNSNGTESTGGTGGAATTPRPAHILGGCDGGDGGDSGVAGGPGGDGGGAVFIATPTTIAIGNNGVISAGGGGGKTGTGAAAGGGGGGSGGFILLEATAITNGGILAANGGGGGEGAGLGLGRDGEDARLSSMKANGGTGLDSQGGNGADGGAGATATGSTATDVQNGGGGGGGGGVGFIATTVVPSPMGTSVISPPRQAWP